MAIYEGREVAEMKLLGTVGFLAFGAGLILVSIALLAFIAFLLALAMCCIVGGGPQGPMDPGWGVFAAATGIIVCVAMMIGLPLLNNGFSRRSKSR